MGPIGDQVSERAQHFGGQLKEATVKAGEKLKSVAEERGLNADGLKDAASEVASAFGSSMSGNAERGNRDGFETQGSAASNKPLP